MTALEHIQRAMPGTLFAITYDSGFSYSGVKYHVNNMHANGQAHISSYCRATGKIVAVFTHGPGVDVAKPAAKTRAEQYKTYNASHPRRKPVPGVTMGLVAGSVQANHRAFPLAGVWA